MPAEEKCVAASPQFSHFCGGPCTSEAAVPHRSRLVGVEAEFGEPSAGAATV